MTCFKVINRPEMFLLNAVRRLFRFRPRSGSSLSVYYYNYYRGLRPYSLVTGILHATRGDR